MKNNGGNVVSFPTTEVTIWLDTERWPNLGDTELHASKVVNSRAEFMRYCERIWTRWERVLQPDQPESETE